MQVCDYYTDTSASRAEIYAEIRDEAVLAEALDYNSFLVAEHHFSDYGIVTSPLILLSWLSQSSSKIGLGTGVTVANFRDPRILAGEIGLLSSLIENRLEIGLGSGFLPNEYAHLELSLDDKRTVFDESYEVIKRLLTEERVSYEGRHFSFEELTLNTERVSKGRVHLRTAVMSKEGIVKCAASGKSVIYAPYASFSNFNEIEQISTQIAQSSTDSSLIPQDHMLTMHCVIAETDEEAKAAAQPAFDVFMNTRLFAPKIPFASFYENSLCLVGSRASVREKLKKLRRWGVDHLLLCFNFGRMPKDRVEYSMREVARLAG